MICFFLWDAVFSPVKQELLLLRIVLKAKWWNTCCLPKMGVLFLQTSTCFSSSTACLSISSTPLSNYWVLNCHQDSCSFLRSKYSWTQWFASCWGQSQKLQLGDKRVKKVWLLAAGKESSGDKCKRWGDFIGKTHVYLYWKDRLSYVVVCPVQNHASHMLHVQKWLIGTPSRQRI